MENQKARAVLNLEADILELTQSLIAIPSESHQETTIADAIESALGNYGHLTLERFGNSIVARTEFNKSERILLAGHIDTVPSSGNDVPQLVQRGQTPPETDTSGVASEDRLYGLGSCDMKGGLAVGLKLAASLKSSNRDLTFMFYESEEVESIHNGLYKISQQKPELFRADFAVLLEPSNAQIEAGCQGTLRFNIILKGRRAHSARAWMGENAVHKAADVLNILNSYSPNVVDVDGLHYREGLQCIGIKGGVAGNVVPDECVVSINYRYAPSKSTEAAIETMRALFAGYTIEIVDNAGGALPGLTHPAAIAFIEASGKGVQPKFGWTDVARMAEFSIPAVNFGPGDPSLAHAPNEYVPIEHLYECERVLSTWLHTN
jgi:succinyl-diaminopimelate desuccinylase